MLHNGQVEYLLMETLEKEGQRRQLCQWNRDFSGWLQGLSHQSGWN